MKKITSAEVRGARMAVRLRNIASLANALAEQIENDPGDIVAANRAMEQIQSQCRLPRRFLTAADAEAFVECWNAFAECSCPGKLPPCND